MQDLDKAWNRLITLISKHGRYRPKEIDYDLALVIYRLGGWAQVCDWTYNELELKKKGFVPEWNLIQEIITKGKATIPIVLRGEHTEIVIPPPDPAWRPDV